MRFAVLKGVQGFGDRLQCLLQAIRYAINTERILVVDWRDTDWTHEATAQGFEAYFRLSGVRSFGLQEFLLYLEHHGSGLSVLPEPWHHKLADWRYQNWVYSAIFSHPKEEGDEALNQVISRITAYERPDFDADVVVLPGVYRRHCNYRDVGTMQLTPWAEERLQALLASGSALHRFAYDAVHLRGGSKPWAGGHVPLKDLADHIEKTWPDEELYFERMHTAYTNIAAKHGELPLLLVSDSQQLVDRWQQRFGPCLHLPTFNAVLEESGTHKISPSTLKQHQIDKQQLNLELIRDFVLLTNARTITWDGISLFSKAAVACRQTGVSLSWLPLPPASAEPSPNGKAGTPQAEPAAADSGAAEPAVEDISSAPAAAAEPEPAPAPTPTAR